MKEILAKHLQLYPQMQIQDAVKLIYQSEFGPGHLIEDVQYAKNWLIKEMEQTRTMEPEIVIVSEKLVRLHLGQMEERHAQLILDAMIQSAHEVTGSREQFIKKLQVLKDSGRFPVEEVDAYVSEYLKKRSLMVSHTEIYRKFYQPHYRVLKKELAEKVMSELHQ